MIRLLARSAILSTGRKYFSLFHNIKIGYEAHPASYPIGTGTKDAGA
jgi:hypothetical protein